MKRIKKLVAACLVMVMAICTVATTATDVQAAAAKKAVTNYKKAPTVKLGKKFTVTAKTTNKKYLAYVKFKAPKAGTYKVTIGNVHSKGLSSAKEIGYGTAYIGRSASYGPSMETVKTQYGKSSSLSLCTKYCASSGKKDVYSYLPSRYGKIKLKKGEVIYIYMSLSATKKTWCYDLKITK